ncbi:major capsid protein [uncultured Caudovirales phage]|uniref:Major capsid protein n=1 Tax=uncultured Caudovirales phage TaxID=2100421 RepID=A0A6J5KFV2_9CAUD|nr:major capsid protein [uncultured Caudovirales phage]
MALLATGALTLADWAKRLDPDGKVPAVAELLTQTNEILEDAVFIEGNLPTGHRVTIRTGLPNVYYRMINQGVPTSKSTTTQVDEACGILEARSHIDVELAKLNGNSAAFRMSEDEAFIEAMNQTMAGAMFYGNPGTDPRQFLGLQPRYSSSSAVNGANVLKAGGAGSVNTSIYLIVWNDSTVFCPFPKGSAAGLMHQDLGEESVPDANGNFFQALRTLYQWKNGLVVKDWRYVVRICNIDTTDLTGQSGTQATAAATNIINLMSRALDRVPQLSRGRAAFYANRTVYSMLRVAALNKSFNVLAIEDGLTQFGTPQKLTTFLGVPLRKVDQILNTEATVS